MSGNEQDVKRSVYGTAQRLDLMSVMGMNRHERRALAKINGRAKIAGSTRSYVNKKKGGNKAA